MIRLPSASLVAMLADLTHTAHTDPEIGGATAGVLLHSDRGYVGADPGKQSVLAGTSMNRRTIGHTYVYADGALPPMLWPIADVAAVIAVLRPKIKAAERADANHAVTLRREGDMVRLVEDLDQKPLFGETQWDMSFALGPVHYFPPGAWHALNPAGSTTVVVDGGRIVPGLPRVDILPGDLAPFVAVGKRRRQAVQTYRRHHRLPILVQIGAAYRGVIVPDPYPDGRGQDIEGETPDASVFAPDLPPPPPAPERPVEGAPPIVDLDAPEWSVDTDADDLGGEP